MRARWAVEAVAIAGLAIATLAAVRLCFGAGAFNLETPWVYEAGDGLGTAMVVKHVMQALWYVGPNDALGAPFGASYHDFPIAESLNFLLVWIFGLFSRDWAFVANVYIILGFVLVAVAAYAVLRDMGIRPEWAGLGGLLFTFLPYHGLRITELGHVWLASYFSVPLAVWMALRVWTEPLAGNAPRQEARRSWLPLLAAGTVVGTSGVYYAYFGAYLIVLAGAAAALAQRSRAPFLRAIALALFVAFVTLLNVIPNIAFRATHGPNPEVAVRNPGEAEYFGLKIAQLLLPQPEHRLEAARAFAARYERGSPLNNENRTASLGLLSSLGLTALLALAFMRLAGRTAHFALLDKLALLAVGAIFLGTMGGFGSVVAWLALPSIRAYNRISIFVGFLSVAAAMGILQALAERWRPVSGGARTAALSAVILALAAGALLDQTAPIDRQRIAAAFHADRDFVRKIEDALPKGAMVYQLPYHPYPESGPRHGMSDYGLVRPYLHSESLRWSYGSMKGREADRWFRSLAERPVEHQLADVKSRGYAAVYVDRRGFADHGVAVDKALASTLGPPRLESPDRHLAMYLTEPGSYGQR